MMTLGLASPGERCEIVEIRHCGGCRGACDQNEQDQGHPAHKSTATRAEEMGLRVGKIIEVLKNDGNLLLLLVDEARIAIDRKMARGIRVKGVAA
jgi:ferrous iron transport protein A